MVTFLIVIKQHINILIVIKQHNTYNNILVTIFHQLVPKFVDSLFNLKNNFVKYLFLLSCLKKMRDQKFSFACLLHRKIIGQKVILLFLKKRSMHSSHGASKINIICLYFNMQHPKCSTLLRKKATHSGESENSRKRAG